MARMFMLFFLTIFICSVLKTSLALDTSKSRSFPVITRQSHRLLGHVLRSVTVPSQISCAHTCMLYSGCVSTNYGLSSGLCELNDYVVGKTGMLEGVLEYQKEFVYSEYRQKDCQLVGCRNGGTCVFSQESKRFHCSCDLRWTGDDCDEKKDFVFNFTTLGSKGSKGPTNGEAYKGTLLETVKINNGIQQWIVPITGRYKLDACGAAGGDGIHGPIGGKGARTSGEMQQLKGTVLNILIGQQGQSKSSSHSGSGGGGTFIVHTNNTPLAIVGGGGGGDTNSGEPGQADRNGSVNGGSDGSGGRVCTGINGMVPDGGSGGGFNGDGCCFDSAPCKCSPHAKAGLSFLNGGRGGYNSGYAYCDGGFGGGGACQVTSGGGGGYSGGGTTDTKGGGGGSFKINESWVITTGVCEGDGYAVFRYINS